MTQDTQIEKKARTRRSPEQRKLDLQAEIKAIELKGEIEDKKALLRIAGELSELAKKRTAQPTIGQAATLVTQAAAAIKADIPQ